MNGSLRLDYGSHRGRQAAPGHRPFRGDRDRPDRGDRQGLLRRLGGFGQPARYDHRGAGAGRRGRRHGRLLAGEGRPVQAGVRDFNTRNEQVNGQPIFVKGENVSSGAALDRLEAGTLQPIIWTPSSSLWGRLLTQTADVTWVPRENASLFRTPLVIAMWEPQARALGWPKKPLGWADVLAERADPQGLGRVRPPGVGRVQARPHEPRLLDLGPVGRRGRVLRRHRQDARA